jgi:hypothetical protein
MGQEICTDNRVPFEILTPLISETAQNNVTFATRCTTGPAKRNDTATIAAHEAFLTTKNHLKIYQTLTQSIQENGKSYKEIMNDISTFIFDVDGVLTDSSVFVTNEEKFFVL